MKSVWIIVLALVSLASGMVSCSGKDDEKPIYTVTFDTDGGTPVPAVQKIEEGSTVIAPGVNPSKTGYAFVHWHINGAATVYNFQSPVRSDLTLHAKWQEEATVEYWQVSWQLNGGAWPSGDNHATQVLKGGVLAEPMAPVRNGYMFEGWHKESALTTPINFPYDVSQITGDFMLYAKWKAEGNPSSNNHNISNAAEWNAAVAAVNAGGSGKTHTFTVTKSFSLAGVGTNTIFNKDLTGLTVTVKGQGNPPEISLSSVGYLIYLASASQKIVLENIVLNGRANNNAAVLCVKSGEMVIGNGAVVTGNTNTAGGGGGVDVGGELILDGGAITGNTSGTAAKTNGHGGGVWVDDMGDFTMESGSIDGNRVYGQGGGVHIDFNAQFTMKGGDIFRNTAWAASSGARGGGVYNVGGYFRMSGGKISGYDWAHGNTIDMPEHYSILPEVRDNCNSVTIGTTVMGTFGAALYSQSGSNSYGTFAGNAFTKTGDFGNSIHIERDLEIADGVRLNRFEVNGETYNTYLGGMDYWGNFFNTTTENVFLGLTSIYGEWITLDMLVPKGKDRLVAGTYTFSTAAGASATAFTFVDNNYTSYVQDANKNRLKMVGGTVNVAVTGSGDNAVYTITVDSTLENGGKVKGTYHGTLKWYDLTQK